MFYQHLDIIRIAKYKRKSTESEERQILSIEAQEDWCNGEIERIKLANPWKIIEVVADISEEKSAKAPWRAWFNELMTVFSEKKADIIVSWKLNRLSRNPIDEWTIKWLCQSFTIQAIHTVDWISNWHNILLMSVHFGMSTQYIIDLSKDIKRWLLQKAKNGWWWRAAPIWYKNINSEVEIDPQTAPIIKEIFRLKHEKNLSDTEIAKIANNLGLRWKTRKINWIKRKAEITNKTIARILENKFYYWAIVNFWEIFIWKHEPLVTKEVFDAINSREKKKYIKHKVWIFKGLVKDFETWENYIPCKKFKKLASWEKAEYVYYMKRFKNWPVKSIWFSELEIINKIKENIWNYNFSEEFLENIKKSLFEYHGILQDNNSSSVDLLNKKISELEFLKDWITEMRAKNELTHEEFLEKKNKIINEIIENRERLKSIDKLSGEIMEKVSILFELLNNLSKKAKDLDEMSIALLSELIIAELKIDKEKRLYIAEKPLFLYIKNFNNVKWWK